MSTMWPDEIILLFHCKGKKIAKNSTCKPKEKECKTMENKKNVNIWKTLQKVPAGTMFVPLIIGAIITTICQDFFQFDLWSTLSNPMKDMFSSSGQMLIIGLRAAIPWTAALSMLTCIPFPSAQSPRLCWQSHSSSEPTPADPLLSAVLLHLRSAASLSPSAETVPLPAH